MFDETLSRAVVTYIWGINGPGWPGERPEALSAVFGDEALDLLPQVRALVSEAWPPYEEWGREDLLTATKRIADRLRRNHPELTDEAIESLANLCAYSMWK